MRISQIPIAKKYAIAYLNVNENSLTEKDMKSIFIAYCFFKKNSDLMNLIYGISFEKEKIANVIDKLCKHFFLPKTFQILIKLLIKHKRIYYLKDVLQDICALYKLRKNILELEIKTANVIDVNEVKELENFFAKQSNFNIESKVIVDSSLIAGVRLQSDFFIWEYSIASKLKALKHNLVIEG